ncbi:MAG: MMPL family transporter [Sandaracinaceae bacterium]|nr:MMPL family transporter [Sandaracinaceae bacterium]
MHPERNHTVLNWLANLVTRRRALVLSVLALLTVALGVQIPDIQADPAPENLISSFEREGEDVAALFERSFGSREKVIALLIQTDDVLSPAALGYVHELSLSFREQPWVESADSITTLPLPRRVRGAAPAPSGESLEDLDDLVGPDDEPDGAPAGESLEDLDDLLGPEGEDGEDSDWAASQDDYDQEMVDALLDIIESYPTYFPGGLAQVGPALSTELRVDPVITGPEVTAEQAREIAMAVDQSPLLIGRLISADHTVAAVAVRLKDMSPRETHRAVDALRQHLTNHPAPAGVSVHIGGLPYLRATMVEKMRNDQLKLIPITLLVCVLLLYLSFRWLPGVFLPLGAVVITTVMVVGGMVIAHEPMNVINNIIPVLLIIIGISDSIHIVGRYREELGRTPDRDEAGRRTIHTMAVACALTSLTTAVGLASLVVSRTVMLRHFGVTSAVGVMVAYVVTMTFLPTIMTWAKEPDQTSKSWGGWLEGSIMLMTARILRRPGMALLGTAIALGALIFVSKDLKVDHALLDQFDPQDDVYVTTRLLEEKLDGVRPLEIVFQSETAGAFDDPAQIARLDAVRDWAMERPEVITGLDHADVIRSTLALVAGDDHIRQEPFPDPRAVHAVQTILRKRDENPLDNWETNEGRMVRLQIMVRDVGAQATMALIDDLEAEIDRVFPEGSGVRHGFTGEAHDGSRGQRAVVHDLGSSLATAIVIIFVLLSLLFRSVRLGLLSIPPNLIPLVGTLAYMVIRGIPLNAATVIIFSISLGLAVDGTIHVLARFREETARGLRSNAALVRAARGTGRAIVVSGLTLMAGFAVLLMSSFVPVRHFGELISVTVALSLLATLVVQPALLSVAGLSRAVRAAHREEDARLAAAVRRDREDG